MPKTLFTVGALALRRYADQLDADAAESLPRACALNAFEAYESLRADARDLRRAAEIKSLASRREYLRAAGWRIDRAI